MDSVLPRSRIEILPISAEDDFASLEEDWRDLELRSGDPSPYLGYDWLLAWLRVYAPERAVVVRFATEEGRSSGLGLIEQGRRGHWRFAGYPVTSHRSLLCEAGSEGACWEAFTGWLCEHRRDWSTLGLEGATSLAAALPSARLATDHFFVADLPPSFDAYVAERGRRTRRTFRQLLRRLDQGGLKVRKADDHQRAICEFVRLHRERASSIGESHWQIDARLSRLLEDLCEAGNLSMPMQELVEGEQAIAVSILIEYGRALYAYNIGVDCTRRNLSPGILLLLQAVRDAIEAGFERIDFGPGEYRYKYELGAAANERYRVVAATPTLTGRVIGFSEAASKRFRSRFGKLVPKAARKWQHDSGMASD